MTHALPGPFRDGVGFFGQVWFMHFNVFEGHGDLAYTRMTFYPLGVPFGMRMLMLWHALFAWVGNLFYDNLVFWYNVCLTGSSVLTAMGVWVLSYRLTRRPGAARDSRGGTRVR